MDEQIDPRHPGRWKGWSSVVMYLLSTLLYINKKGYNSKSVRSGTKAGDSSILFLANTGYDRGIFKGFILKVCMYVNFDM